MLVSGALAILACALAASGAPSRPNFVVILTDDQDSLLQGLEDMPETLALLRAGGREYSNAFVDTPICCPSRTSTLSGRYGHNLAQQATQDWCGAFTGHAIENATWITALQDAGYTTSMSGKYHNAPPQKFVPKGWSDFFSLNNECQYFNNTFNDNGKHVVFGDAPTDYMTSLIGNRSLTFLRGALAASQPFLAYIAPHASHMPTTPAPWYAEAPLPSYAAPRTPQYNTSGEGKHWVLAGQPPMSQRLAEGVDAIYTARHRALLSVDDIVRDVAALLSSHGELDNTYWFYTSDHGYNCACSSGTRTAPCMRTLSPSSPPSLSHTHFAVFVHPLQSPSCKAAVCLLLPRACAPPLTLLPLLHPPSPTGAPSACLLKSSTSWRRTFTCPSWCVGLAWPLAAPPAPLCPMWTWGPPSWTWRACRQLPRPLTGAPLLGSSQGAAPGGGTAR